MKHKGLFTYSLILGLVILLNACGTPKATPCQTAEPQACPTTSTAKLPPEINNWRQTVASQNVDFTFTFEPGDKCTMSGKNKIYSSTWVYEIVVNDQSHLNYIVFGGTVNAGSTIEEANKWTQEHPNSDVPPPQITLRFYDIVIPMSRTLHAVTYTGDPIYFTCITQGPDAHNVIASFDPVEVPKD